VEGKVVPDENVALKDGMVKIEAAILYADLADSTGMVRKLNKKVAAKVMKSFLRCASRCILHRGGAIRSFDGDRVMGVFIGDSKASAAAHCALNINFAVEKVIRPALVAQWSNIEKFYTIKHAVGADMGEILVVRGGVRDNNDLVWVGTAPNDAARLSERRYPTVRSLITKAVYSLLDNHSKFANGKPMWFEYSDKAKTDINPVYGSAYFWGD
jgi:class 3 adenylate cyclase